MHTTKSTRPEQNSNTLVELRESRVQRESGAACSQSPSAVATSTWWPLVRSVRAGRHGGEDREGGAHRGGVARVVVGADRQRDVVERGQRVAVYRLAGAQTDRQE